MKIDWKSKLSSRKFWAAVIGFVTALLTVFGLPELTIEQVCGMVAAGGVLVAYILGESSVDAARAAATLPEENENGDEAE